MALFRMDSRKDLLQSRVNSAQCCAAGWMGGDFEVERIQVYVWLSPFAVHRKHIVSHNIVNQLYSNIK